MEALSIESLEQSILRNGADLSAMNKAAPLKTREEIRADWLQERIGKFTASEFYRLTADLTKKDVSEGRNLPRGAITYATEKAVERLTEFLPDSFTSWDMQWGLDNEMGAVEAFTEATGLKVGFTGSNQKFLTIGSNIGGTPDGLIGTHSGVEIKCPNSITHFKYMSIKNTEDLKDAESNYYWQIQGLMMICKCDHWYFVSYDPRYKKKEHQLHFVKILANEDDQFFLMTRLKMAIELRDELLQGFIEINDKHITQSEVMNILGIKRTKLFCLRKAGKFPAPFSDVPLLWKAVDIENYALNLGVIND